ncbi:MAG: hypothetical protein GY757_14220 [bacterium]|nr:hypothetical protein [bacterium]
MIRLKKQPKPKELTPEKQQELTARFKEDEKKAVWQQTYIKKALLEMSQEKCCYCELKIDEKCNHLEVEHYYPKSKYQDKVVEWDNLLPSCKRCNGKKGEYDTGIEPIIHPVRDEPKDHLYFKNHQIRAKKGSKLGERTVDLLDLNELKSTADKVKGIQMSRFETGAALTKRLKELDEDADQYFKEERLTPRRRNRLINTLRELLTDSTPLAAFSASTATLLLNEEYYTRIKKKFIANKLWSDELQTLEDEAKTCALEYR